jgi:hypothetical protein
LRLERCAVAQESPNDARHLGSEGDDNRIGMSSRKETTQPPAEPSVASAQGRQSCASALNQHLAPAEAQGRAMRQDCTSPLPAFSSAFTDQIAFKVGYGG